MGNLTELTKSMDGNIIEYCILGGIVVLIIILIVSIISCIKSLGNEDLKRKYNKIKIETDDLNSIPEDPVQELIDVALEEQKLNKMEVKEQIDEPKIAEKIEITEIIEASEEKVLKEETKSIIEKLDIKSITREMELRLEEEPSEIEAYEDEQEKTAIISYKELLAAAAKIEANADKEEEYIDDVVFEFNSKKIVQEEQPKHAMKKFSPTIDISPVFGARKNEGIFEQDDILRIEEVTEEEHELEKNREQFLKNLQDFRNNLD